MFGLILIVKNSILQVRDDGTGMTTNSLQNRFLNLGYTKREDPTYSIKYNRPIIGSRGIGKISILTLANQISIVTKTKETETVGITIDRNKLDQAIRNDATPNEFSINNLDQFLVYGLKSSFEQGTIIQFSGIDTATRNRIEDLGKIIVQTCQYALNEEKFKIYLNGRQVTINELDNLLRNSQFCWVINNFSDNITKSFSEEMQFRLNTEFNYNGFIATVTKPKHRTLSVIEGIRNYQATIDLFNNGHLSEKDIIRHIPSHRLFENYAYGHIHFDNIGISKIDSNSIDQKKIMEYDPNFLNLLYDLKYNILKKIIPHWSSARRKLKKEN